MTVTYYNSNSNRENLVLVETHKRRVSIMSVINELIRTEANGTLSFGNYSLAAKSKTSSTKVIFIKLRHLRKSQS